MVAEPSIDSASRLPKLRQPTLVAHGALDVFHRDGHMRCMQSLIPDSELVVMQGT